MPDELIIDIHAHVYQTPEMADMTMQSCDRPPHGRGTVDELRAIMREMDIWRTAKSFDPSRGSARSWILALAHHKAVAAAGKSSIGNESDIFS